MKRSTLIAAVLVAAVAAWLISRREAGPRPDASGTQDATDEAIAPNSLTASDGELAAGRRGSMPVPAATARVPLTVSDHGLTAGPRVSRTLLDEEGKPIAGAVVTAIEEISNADGPLGFEHSSNRVIGEGTTDDRGRVALRLIGTDPPQFLRIAASGRAVVTRYAFGETRVLRLRHTTPIRGRVLVRGTEAAVEGAVVEARVEDGIVAGSEGPPPRATSAADGSYQLDVPAGSLVAVSVRGGLDSMELLPGRDRVDNIVLHFETPREVGRVEGKLLFDGRPLVGARVILPRSWGRLEAVASEPTGPDGRYDCGPIRSGPDVVVIDANAAGLGSVRQHVSYAVRLGSAHVDHTFGPGFRISGRVTRAEIGVANARISLSALSRDGDEAGRSEVQSDLDGSFRLAGLFEPSRPCRIQVTTADADRGFADVRLEPGVAQTSGVLIELAAAGRVRGRVLDGAERPIEFARVTGRGDVVTGPDGRFDVPVNPGRARVAVKCPGYVSRTSAWTQVPPGDQGAIVDVVLDLGGIVTGRVTDATGKPIRDAVIDVRGSGGIGGGSIVRTWGSDGRFASQIVAGSSLTVTISADGFTPRTLSNVEPDADLGDVVLESSPPK